MFFLRWEEGLCVMFLKRNFIRSDEVPDEAQFLQPAQYPPSGIKFAALQSQLCAFGESVMIVVPAFSECDEAEELHWAGHIMPLHAVRWHVKTTGTVIMREPPDEPMPRDRDNNPPAYAPCNPAPIAEMI